MSTVNYHTSRSSNLAALNAIVLNVSTLTGSTIQTTATATTSSIVFSTMSGSTLTTSTMTGNQITISTLTVSSINNGTPGVAAYSTFNASSINVTSTTTTSTLSTLLVNTGSLSVSGNMTSGTTNTGNLTILAASVFKLTGGNSGANYTTILGNDTGSSPYITFHQNNTRRMYVGNASATDAIIASENGAQLVFTTQGTNRVIIDTTGNTDFNSRELRISQLSSNVCQLRMKSGNTNIGSMFHCNGSELYILATNNGDWTGNYNGFRPFYLSLAGNGCFMGEGLSVTGGSIRCGNQPFVIVGGVAGSNITYTAGTNFGSSGNLLAYTSAGYSNTSGSGWESSTGRFWATLLGRYQVNFTFFWNSFTAGARAVMRHFNSAGTLLEDRYCAASSVGHGSDTVQTYSAIVYMSAGNYLEFNFQSGGGSLFFGGINHTHCSFHFIA